MRPVPRTCRLASRDQAEVVGRGGAAPARQADREGLARHDVAVGRGGGPQGHGDAGRLRAGDAAPGRGHHVGLGRPRRRCRPPGRALRVKTFLVVGVAALLAAAALASVATAAPPPAVTPTDYSQSAHWLQVPRAPRWKVDVFYLYPSAYTKTSPRQPNICPVDDPGMMQGAQVAFCRQATAFAPYGDIYAPYYRQADAAWSLSLPPAEHARVDRRASPRRRRCRRLRLLHQALQPRPPVHPRRALAGIERDESTCSRSTCIIIPSVYRRMIAAYRPRLLRDAEYLATTPFTFATGAADTRVIISVEHRGADHRRAQPRGASGRPRHQPDHVDAGGDRGHRGAEPGLDPAGPRDRRTAGARPRAVNILRVPEPRRRPGRQAKGVVICSTVNPPRTTSLRIPRWASYHTSTTPSTSSTCGPTPRPGPSTSSPAIRLPTEDRERQQEERTRVAELVDLIDAERGEHGDRRRIGPEASAKAA